MSKPRLVSMGGAKGNLFTLGEAGETHTVSYATKSIKTYCNEFSEHLINTIPTNEIWCFSVNEDNNLQVCRLIDIDFNKLGK